MEHEANTVPEATGTQPVRPQRRISNWRTPRGARKRRFAAAASDAQVVIGRQPCAAGPALALLGAPRVRIGGAWHDLPPARWSALLAYVARSGTWVRREALTDMFWPDQERERAFLNLRQTLQTIARSAAAPAFAREPTRVCWRGSSDVGAFESRVRAGAWREAVAAYGGPFLDGLELSEVTPAQAWLDVERSALESWWRTGLLTLAQQELRSGRPLEALALADRLVRRDQLDEAAACLALESAMASGDRLRGERTYQSLRATLRAELGVEPEEETRALARRLGVPAA